MLTAIIDPNECIGCGICLEKCPFDAIIGAPGQMHTVLVAGCIGCKLCISPCPVDCIRSAELPAELLPRKKQIIAQAKQRRKDKINRINNLAKINLARQAIIAEDLKKLIFKDPESKT